MSSASSGGIVVEHSADNPKIKGLNHAAGTGRDKRAKISPASDSSKVVEHSTHLPKS